MSEVSRLLNAAAAGDNQAAADLLPLVYDELRRLAAARLATERPGHTLQPTALVHEAYLRLVAGAAEGGPEVRFVGRGHFFAAAAEAMRRILVDAARRRRAVKHGGGFHKHDANEVPLVAPEPVEDLVALDEALTQLAADNRPAAELVTLRYFGGLTLTEAAETLGLSERTARRLWAYARAWLRRAIEGPGGKI